MFPIKPLLDRVIVREIPVAEYYRVDEQSKLVDLGNANIKVLSDRGYVEAVGSDVKDVKVGDTVMFDEFARNDEVFLNPADKNRSDLPHYFRIREADLQGIVSKRTIGITKEGHFDSHYCEACDIDFDKTGEDIELHMATVHA